VIEMGLRCEDIGIRFYELCPYGKKLKKAKVRGKGTIEQISECLIIYSDGLIISIKYKLINRT